MQARENSSHFKVRTETKTGAIGARFLFGLTRLRLLMVVVVTVIIAVASIFAAAIFAMFMTIIVPRLIVMLLDALMSPAFGGALPLAAFEPLVMVTPFRTANFNAADGVGVNVSGAVDPGPSPTGVVDVDHAIFPTDPVIAPAPRPICRAHRHAETEADRGSDVESRTRRHVNNCRIIVGHHDVIG